MYSGISNHLISILKEVYRHQITNTPFKLSYVDIRRAQKKRLINPIIDIHQDKVEYLPGIFRYKIIAIVLTYNGRVALGLGVKD